MLVLHLKVPFSKTVYIERSDFRLKDSKDYYGLAPGKSVLLRYDSFRMFCCYSGLVKSGFHLNLYVICRYAFPIKCTEVILADDKETVLEIQAEYDPSKKMKPKVHLLFCHLLMSMLNDVLRLLALSSSYSPFPAHLFCSFFFIFVISIIIQGVLHWVAEPLAGVSPLQVEVRLFDKLFLSEVWNFCWKVSH